MSSSCTPTREIVSRDPEGVVHRTNYGEIAARARRLADALRRLGVAPGDRVATLAWNSFRHLEIYYGVTSSGLVLHTVNPRLFPEQLQYIMHHAEDAYVCFDPVFAPLVESLAPHLPLVKGWIALCDRAAMPAVDVANLLCYEELLADADRRISPGRGSTRTPPARSATPPARRAIRRACSTATARRCCTASPPAPPTRSALRRARLDPDGRAAVPRQRLEPAVLRRDGRRQNDAARAEARPGKPLHLMEAEGLHQGVRHPDHLAQFPRLGGGQQEPRRDRAELKLKTVVSGGAAAPRSDDREIPRSVRRRTSCTPGA